MGGRGGGQLNWLDGQLHLKEKFYNHSSLFIIWTVDNQQGLTINHHSFNHDYMQQELYWE